MLKFTSKNILEGIMPGTDCENYFKFKWLGESSTKSFYIGDDENQKRRVLDFLSGRQECFIDKESFFKYLDDLKEIVEKFKFLFYGPINVLSTIRAHFVALNTNECSIYVSYRQGDRYLKASSLDKNVNEFRNALVPNITNLKIVKNNGKYIIYVSLIDEWREVIMKANSKLTVEKLCKIYDEFMKSEINNGKTPIDSALLFGIKYAQLFDNFQNVTINELLKESTYNTNECIAYVLKGTMLSSSILWETGMQTDISDKPSVKEEKIDLKEEFKEWLSKQYTKKGTLWTDSSIAKCVTVLVKGFNNFDKYEDYNSFFEIVELSILNDYQSYLKVQKGVNEFDDQEKGWFYKGLEEYEFFLQDYKQNELEKLDKITYETLCSDEITLGAETIKLERNRIFFGAPGTGKSHELDKQTKAFAGDSYERVTFHPEYTHSGFFGTYKPIPSENNKDKITYEFIPGPFLRVLSKALINANVEVNPHPFVLLIEEINRANMAAVFGEVFQLLDRDDSNASKYSISPSEDVKNYLVKEFGKAGVNVTKGAFDELKIPNNMFIWASMNSADQGVFPMDTAFKRRWDFEYFNIDDNEDVISSYTFNICGENVNWNSLRKAINQRLISLRINEDKLLGPFFIGESVLREGNNEKIIKAIKNKVIMYLFEDAARQKRKDVFVNGYEKTYSQICEDFDTKGLGIFTTENT